MGTTFEFVADVALVACDGDECHHCGRNNVPLYDYFGSIIDPELSADPQLANVEPDVSWLCADCINGGNVQRSDAYSVEDIVRSYAADPVAAMRDFNKLPNIPLFLQNFDWPLCCGNWAEFIGSPASLTELITVQDTYSYWQNGPADARRDFATQGPPEYLPEISLFCCKKCNAHLYTDQFT